MTVHEQAITSFKEENGNCLEQTWFCTTGDIKIVTVPAGGVAMVEFSNEHNFKGQALPMRVLFILIARFGILISNPAKILI
jgi:hypothetical protein